MNVRASRLAWLMCLAGVAITADAAPVVDPNQSALSTPLTGSLRREVFHQQVAALAVDPNQSATKSAEELAAWLERLNALALPPSRQAPAGSASKTTPKSVAPVAPESRVSTAPPPAEPNAPAVDPLVTMAQDAPERVAYPLKAADVLFSAGRLDAALLFYRVALGRTKADAADKDRPWILLQMANCLRRRDGDKAQTLYQQLRTEYPDHPFTEIARAHQQVLALAQQEKPWTILQRYGHDPNDF